MTRFNDVRAALRSELRDVLATSDRLTKHLRNWDRTLPADAQELAQFVENDEVLEALDVRARERIGQLRTAIARIDAGEYDQCAACDGAIEEGRLEVLPTTSICAGCATAGE